MSEEQIEILSDWYTELPTSFMRHGNCQGMDTNLFFPYKGESAKEALSACNGTDRQPECPVKSQCLEYALSLPSLCVGIWGGTSQKERRRLRADKTPPQPIRWR